MGASAFEGRQLPLCAKYLKIRESFPSWVIYSTTFDGFAVAVVLSG
jgi:hypothetical protein